MKKLSPFLYILPAAAIIVLFRLIPIIISFVISFYEWGVDGMGDFIGLKNYIDILVDNEFWQSMVNTFWLVIFVVPSTLILSLVFANMLNSIKFLKAFFRTVYFIPTVTSMVAISIVWKIIYNQQSGLANYLLRLVGLDPLGWLAESTGVFELMARSVGMHLPIYMQGPSLALFSIILLCVWRSLGYNTLIYLAGLQNIPGVYYEAASIDGASKTRQFLDITIPMVSPTTYYVMMMTTITTFQVFSQVYLMTGPPIGGPLGTTKVIVYYIFDKGFGESGNLSYASAIALVLFAIILTLTLLQKRLEKHVHY